MKRSADSAEPDHHPKAARRQDPVSCHFCRQKKLKCDRMTPCSNCRARKRVCVSANDPNHTFEGTPEPSGSTVVVPSQTIDDLNTRLKRLEDLLSNSNVAQSARREQAERPTITGEWLESRPRKAESNGDDVELSKTVVWLETDAFDYKPSPSEMHYNNPSTPHSQSPDSFATSFLPLFSPPSDAGLLEHQSLCSILPSRAQAEILMEYYTDRVNWIYHILHMPTVYRMVDAVYTAVEQHQQPHYGQLSLVSTVFALSAYFGYSSPTFQFKGSEAREYSHRWVSLAQAALAAANFINIPSIETIQAAIMLAQHLLPNVGAIATFRTLAATCMNSARALMLHQLDSPTNKKRREGTVIDYVDLEIKRRLWWHLASTDWTLSFMSGPQCGTYMIHRKQMHVDYPANVNDAAIGSTPDYPQPIDIPTEMTYFIFRNRISEVFRDIVDAAANADCELEDLPYEDVLEFDKKLHQLMNDAPLFFKFDPRSRAASDSVDHKMPFIPFQRNMGQFGLHTRLSRLHRPYLARGAHDPRYSYSRIVCLRSARTVIELGAQMMKPSQNFEPIRVWTIVHHIFVSTVILVMDYCFNREDPQATLRKEEILECFRLLERSQEESTIARQGLKQLREFLNSRKWRAAPEASLDVLNTNPQPAPTELNNPSSSTSLVHVPTQAYGYQPGESFAGYEYNGGQPFAAGTQNANAVTAPQQWTNMDDSLLEYLNFDANLDSAEWDTLFQNVEGNNPLY